MEAFKIMAIIIFFSQVLLLASSGSPFSRNRPPFPEAEKTRIDSVTAPRDLIE